MPLRFIVLLAMGIVMALLTAASEFFLPQAQWINEALHSGAEAISAMAAILLGVFLLGADEGTTWNHPVAGMGFIGMGVMDAVHAISPGGQATEFLRLSANLSGAIGIALTWLPPGAGRGFIARWGGWITAVFFFVFGIMVLTQPEWVPRMVAMPDPESFMADTFTSSALWLNALALVMLSIGCIRFISSYARSGSMEDLLFSGLGLALALSCILFPLDPLWGANWWQWHLIRVTGYIAVLTFLVWRYSQLTGTLSLHRDHLQDLVFERTVELERSQAQLRLARDELEARVCERTAELEDVAEELKAEMEDRKKAQELVHARLRLLEFASQHSLQELLVAALDEVCAISRSPIGFLHFLEKDQKTLTLQAWSTRTEQEYCTAKGKGDHYPVDAAGVWVDCIHQRGPVIHNDYASLPNKKGLPAGHAPLIRELVVPVFRGGLIVAILGVGNKSEWYGQADVEVVAYLADVAWEIAERKKSEEKIAQQAAILESSEDAILGKTTEGVITSWNRGAQIMYGFTAEEMIGTPVAQIVPPEKLEEWKDILRRIAAEEHVEHMETIRLGKDGSRIPVSLSVSPIRNAAGEIVGASSIARNISKRKAVEERLREVSALNQKIIQSATVGIFACRADGPCVLANSAVANISGTTPEKMMQLNFRSLEKWKKNGLFDIAEKTLLTGEEQQAELHTTTTFGRDVWLHYYFTTFRSGGDLHFLMLVDDISERKLLEEAQKKALEELQRSNLELEQFAYVASHDLQEPLRMVSSFTQLLAKRYAGTLDKDADEFIGYAVDGATRMQHLINDLLAYSRVGSRGKPLQPIACDAALDIALRNLQLAVEEKHAVILRRPLPIVLADELQLVQLFQNLIGNAIKFMGDAPPQVEISAEPSGAEWLFAVRDNGIGIEPQYLERIFVIFQRLHERSKYPGTGIGLAVCKKIVLRHGGRIWAESKPGDGTTFFFTLPYTEGNDV
jgi:PAS domain S-box-containing protein